MNECAFDVRYFLLVNLDANGAEKCAYSLQQTLGVRYQLRFIANQSFQIRNFLILRRHLFAEHLHLQRQRFLVSLQTTKTFIGILTLGIKEKSEK